MDRVKPKARSSDKTGKGRTAVIIGILILIALAHILRVGTYLRGSLFTIYYSYFSDVFIPFGMYFLLSLNDVYIWILRDWRLKAILVVGVASSTEVMQAFGVHLLGETFDPLDFIMFGGGVLLAVIVEKTLIDRLLPRRTTRMGGPTDATR
jgi:hypothetical protein